MYTSSCGHAFFFLCAIVICPFFIRFFLFALSHYRYLQKIFIPCALWVFKIWSIKDPSPFRLRPHADYSCQPPPPPPPSPRSRQLVLWCGGIGVQYGQTQDFMDSANSRHVYAELFAIPQFFLEFCIIALSSFWLLFFSAVVRKKRECLSLCTRYYCLVLHNGSKKVEKCL